MAKHTRREIIGGLGVATATALVPAVARAQSAPIRIGYALSKSGPFAGGASATQVPFYKLWVDDVNKAGGISVGGTKRTIEVVEYDDRSQAEEAVRAVERLISEDKVDFILPPWGTGMNLAVAPAINKGNYPHIAPSFITDRMPELVKRWPNIFALLSPSSAYAEGLVTLLSQMRTSGKIGNKVTMVNVTDQFGLDLSNAATKALAAGKFDVVGTSSYPLATQDLSPIIADMQRHNADVFIAFSYPPDTIGLTEAARVRNFNPKVFFVGVGSALPLFPAKFGANTEGVMGPGGWNPETDAMKAFVARYRATYNTASPDPWGGILCYCGLQALQQSIEKVGSRDRTAIIKTLASTTFDTVSGPLQFENNILRGGWAVGQWQGGVYRGVGPSDKQGAAPVIAKPDWKA
jgi:branched-chain amino acid transport system substrate-binding protein